MNILLGFGKAHLDKARFAVAELANCFGCEENKKNAKAISDEFALSEGFYETSNNEFRNMRILTTHIWSDYDKHWACVIEGIYSCYRDDHPMSPDGFACLDIRFCLTIKDDDVWGRREFISLGDSHGQRMP